MTVPANSRPIRPITKARWGITIPSSTRYRGHHWRPSGYRYYGHHHGTMTHHALRYQYGRGYY